MESVSAAALDLGSNSFHLVVGRVHPNRLVEPIYEDKVMLRLGERVARVGYLDDEALALATETLERFVEIGRAFGAQVIIAGATASFRDAENGFEAARALSERIGVPIRVLSGHEEAEAIFAAIRSAGMIGEIPVVAADLGGGSLELVVGTQRHLIRARSLPVGVGKLVVRRPLSDPPSPLELASLAELLRAHLDDELVAIRAFDPQRLILTSGTFLALAKLARRLGGADELADGQVLRVVDPRWLREAAARVECSTRAERARRLRIDQRRLDTAVVGAVVLEELLGQLPVREIWTSRWALREGLLIQAVEEDEHAGFAFDASELLEGSVRHLMEKYHVDEAHAHAVERWALVLLDALGALLALDSEERTVLSVAARLHDVGAFVAERDHDRHGAYLLRANPPRGLSQRDQLLVSAVVLNHRRGGLREPDELPERDRRRVEVLTALLRVADALDVSHTQAVHDVRVVVRPDDLVIEARSTEPLGAERSVFGAKAALLNQVTGRRVRLEVVGPGEDDWAFRLVGR